MILVDKVLSFEYVLKSLVHGLRDCGFDKIAKIPFIIFRNFIFKRGPSRWTCLICFIKDMLYFPLMSGFIKNHLLLQVTWAVNFTHACCCVSPSENSITGTLRSGHTRSRLIGSWEGEWLCDTKLHHDGEPYDSSSFELGERWLWERDG